MLNLSLMSLRKSTSSLVSIGPLRVRLPDRSAILRRSIFENSRQAPGFAEAAYLALLRAAPRLYHPFRIRRHGLDLIDDYGSHIPAETAR
jgi:hypothetical protein